MSRKSFNFVMTAGFVIFAILAIAADWNYRISLMGLGTLLVLLALGNALYYHSDKKTPPKPRTKRRLSFTLFLTFLACELAIIVAMFILGDSASLETQKLLSCLLCVVLFCVLLSGYRYELSRFQDSKSFSETRALGIAINPKHPLGRVIYIGAFSIIILIFCLLLFFGPTD